MSFRDFKLSGNLDYLHSDVTCFRDRLENLAFRDFLVWTKRKRLKNLMEAKKAQPSIGVMKAMKEFDYLPFCWSRKLLFCHNLSLVWHEKSIWLTGSFHQNVTVCSQGKQICENFQHFWGDFFSDANIFNFNFLSLIATLKN